MSSRIRLHRQRGFTLAEILVTTAIFAIIMIAALAVYDQSNRVFKSSTESADLQQSTRIGFDKLVSDLRMAGFDYNRGGVPQQTWQAPQPDEQIEYAGPSAVVFRANFNYNSATTQGNGLEPAFTPVNVNGQSIFPYVTTSDNEIVAYVLRSTNAAANTGSIAFYVDDFQPRAAFPSTLVPAPSSANPSRPERVVAIGGIDTTNNNPPYTLFRVTVADVHNGALGTPVADNIRSLRFQYFTDLNGTALLTNADGTAIVNGRDAGGGTFAAANTGAIGGDGQYDPNNVGAAPNFVDRTQRARIASIRVSLVGMNASPDLSGYTNPTETIASIKNYRQYSLSSLVAPRNLGLTGFPEPSYTPPSPPTITGMCIGHCGAPVIYWQPPITGPVVKYHIEWDSNPNGAFPLSQGFDVTDPSATTATFLDDGASDVSLPRYYRMEAINDNGQSPPSQVYTATPLNSTKPNPPTNVSATGGTNQLTVTWTAPTINQPGGDVLACTGTGGSTTGTNIPPQEIVKFRVYRGTTSSFDPATQGVRVLYFTSPSQPPQASPGGAVTWVDSPATSAFPAANCVPYYYRVVALDRCFRTVNGHNQNAPGSPGSISDPAPGVASAAFGPVQATTTIAPSTPAGLAIDPANTSGPYGSGLPNMYWYIGLTWPKVTTDTAGNATAIDTYRITRMRRPQSTGGAFVVDPTFPMSNPPTPGLNISGFSQTSGASASWVDKNPTALGGVPYSDPANITGPWEYQYTVAAKSCPNYSGESTPALFPGCTTPVSIVPGGTLGLGSGTGDSPTGAWIMQTGNSITVSPGVGVTLASVKFDLYTYSCPGVGCAAGTLLNSQTISSPGPYTYPWSDLTSNAVYQVVMTITDSSGCSELRQKFVQQEPQAGCVFSNIPAVVTVTGVHPSFDEKDAVTFTITNTNGVGGDALRFNIPGSFQSTASIQWSSPQPPNYPDLQLSQITWSWNIPGNVGSSTDTICAFGACPQPGSQTISSLTSSGTTATATTSLAHGLATGQTVRIAGATPPAYNGTFVVTVLSATQFTYTFAGGISPATGTIGESPMLTTTRSVPTNVPDIPPGSTLTIQLQYEFDGRFVNSLSQTPPLPAIPIAKFCLNYRINSDLSRTAFCNVVGQAVAPATTNNPASCD